MKPENFENYKEEIGPDCWSCQGMDGRVAEVETANGRLADFEGMGGWPAPLQDQRFRVLAILEGDCAYARSRIVQAQARAAECSGRVEGRCDWRTKHGKPRPTTDEIN